jgi:hypothetical protein
LLGIFKAAAGKTVQLKISKKSKSKTKVPSQNAKESVSYSETAVVNEDGTVEWDNLQVFKFEKQSKKKAHSKKKKKKKEKEGDEKDDKKQPSYIIQLSLSYYNGKKKKKLYVNL